MHSRTLSELSQYDTPTVCNVIELFHVRPRNSGYMNAGIRSCFPDLPPMVGFALTSTFRSNAPPPQGSSYSGLIEQIELYSDHPGSPVMVFEDLDTPTAAATFGEVMCTMYKSFGAAGLITSGAGRDLDQVSRLDFPVFTNGTICSHGYCHIPQINIPVNVGGLVIDPGTLLHGDCNGVTTIPIEIADEIPDACAELMAAEQVVLEYCRSGDINPRGLKEAKRECDDLIAVLSKRLTRRSSQDL
ncbi:RraA family protein [Planctomicrobium sp. SH668]|uniref:RraA family protein n=1 Tax=Planctomicrobium sp. SH668 TaxID=3448126 RepID=UPI003F5B48FF